MVLQLPCHVVPCNDCVELREVRSSQAPLGTPIGVSASSRGDGPDLRASSLTNPVGVAVSTSTHSRGRYHHPWCDGIVRLRSLLWSVGICGVVSHSSWDSGSSPSSTASSIGVGEATGSSPTASSMEASNRLSLSIRGLTHLQRSWNALQSMPGGAPNHLAHHCRPLPVPPSGLILPLRCPRGLEGEGGRIFPLLWVA